MILPDYAHLPAYSDRLKLSTRLMKQIARAKPAFFIFVVLALVLGGESIADVLADWVLL